MDIKVASGVIDRILREAGKAHPREACGILLGEGDRISDCVATCNVHPAPATHFEIDPQALIDAHRAARKGGPQVIGYYHSHPEGDARPSKTDRAMSSGDGRIWVIVAGQKIGVCRDDPDGFTEVSYAVADD